MAARQLILRQIPISHRTIGLFRSGVTVAIAVLVSATGAFAAGTTQKAPPVTATPSGAVQKAPSGTTAAPATKIAPASKIEAQNLTVTPAQPKAGDPVTVKFTVKNTGPGTVAKVPWSIHLYTGNRTLGQGEQLNVAAGATFEVTAPWTPAAGSQRLQGYVDPNGKTLKNTATVAAQVKELTLNVAQVSAATQASSPPVEKERKILDVSEAKLAGARFDHGIESGGDCRSIGAFDPKTEYAQPQGTVTFKAGNCLLTGGKATPQAFLDFTLKNGWVVKDYRPVYNNVQYNGECKLLTPPAIGSNNPYMKAHVWVNATGNVALTLQVTIEGPKGTNPYH